MYPPICSSSVLLAQLKKLTMVIVMAEELKDTVDVQEVHIVEVLVPMKDLGGSPN